MPARSRRWPNWCARMSRSSPRSRRCIWNISARSTKIADAKAEIFAGLEPGGAAMLNRDNAPICAARRRRQGRRRCPHRHVRRACRGRCAAVCAIRCRPIARPSQAHILGAEVTYKLGAPGRHLVLNSLAVLAAATLVGADLALAALALDRAASRHRPRHAHHAGGARRQRAADRRELQRQSRPRCARPSRCSARPRSARSGRRIAVLGDMLELGAQRRGAAPRTGRADRGGSGRSGVLLRPGNAKSVGGASLRAAGAAMPRPRRRSNRRCSRPFATATR